MSFSSYFKGKNSLKLWLNILLMLLLLFGIPTLIFLSLNIITHHGEKVEVPDVRKMSMERAKSILESKGFVVVISDSVEEANVRPGAVLEQTPKPGTEIKSGRIVYLVTRYMNEALIEIPKLVGEHSYRETKIILTNLGFKFTPDSLIDDQEEEYLLGIYQGKKRVFAGDKLVKSKPLTLYVGSGIMHEPDTIEEKLITVEKEATYEY